MTETDFIRHFIAHAPQIMWLLGAGVSRTAGMPTASDITWDLKVRYYCLKENEDISQHDINNETVRKRVQTYLDSKGFPRLNSQEEYSFYFELTFGNDYAEQQKYLSEQLATEKVSLNVGHRALAALISLKLAKVVFTTNFDHVMEDAYSSVTGNNLSAYHLDGSYAALEALNSESFPIYAKLHGDFKYQSIKNLSTDLQNNDKKIQDCFLAACSRYGLVISGYSGRDKNVMQMLYTAIEQHNAFPSGIFWTVVNRNEISESISNFIDAAKTKGINSHILETGTFDTLLSKIWRQVSDKPKAVDEKVKSGAATKVAIPFTEKGTTFPLVRTNALQIIECPSVCAAIGLKSDVQHDDLKKILGEKYPEATITKYDKIYGWGKEAEFKKVFGDNIDRITPFQLNDNLNLLQISMTMRSFFERALAASLCNKRPVFMRFSHKSFYAVINHEMLANPLLSALKKAVADKGVSEGNLVGKLADNVFWAEACEIRLEIRNSHLWLMLKPTIWIKPDDQRKNYVEFLKKRRAHRYNMAANNILDAWIKILLGNQVTGEISELKCYDDSEYPVTFKINSRTAYSKR